jgi:hypothetical protein
MEKVMKAIALLLITGILMVPDQGKSSEPDRKDNRFDYATRIGIVFRNEEKQLRLEIKNPNLAANDEIVVVDPNEPQKIARAAIVEKVSGDCSQARIYDGGGACYKLQAISGKIDEIIIAFGIAKAPASFAIRRGSVSTDLDNDRVAEHFRVCASMEGPHLTVWSGRPLEGKRQWHRYFYLGYDLEPNCVEGDTKGIADK